MLLAELEVCHSRPIAPTRRVALGRTFLPCDPVPGFGGLLLGGVVARFAQDMDPDDIGELLALIYDLDAGYRIPQPRLRHRFQADRVGLTRSSHRLYRVDDSEGELRLQFTTDKGAPSQHVLGAVYAAGRLPSNIRTGVFANIRRALAWRGEINLGFLAYLAGGASSSFLRSAVQHGAMSDNVDWAMRVLGLSAVADRLDKGLIQQGYRDALLTVHPDHGGEVASAAERIADIAEARRILLAQK